MLTAVENHFGPGRPYPTSHYGAVLAPCPMTPLPTLNSATAVAMSAAEFARPHPKTTSRYNTSQALLRDEKSAPYTVDTSSFHLRSPSILRHMHPSTLPSSAGRTSLKAELNGDCLSERRASLEQNGPVNLATSSAQSTASSAAASPSLSAPSPESRRKSPQSAFSDPVTNGSSALNHQQAQSHSEQDAIHRSIASLYGPPKLPFCPPPVSSVNSQNVAAAYQLSFSSIYNRAYGSSGLYGTPHPMASSIHHNRPTYIPSHVDPYNHPYLAPPPPSHASTVLSPQAPIVIGPAQVAVAATISQKNSMISNNLDVGGSDRSTGAQSSIDGHSASTLINPKETIKSSSSLTASSSTAVATTAAVSAASNQISANGSKSNGFKVPSGKEGSLKHRILTRPYGEKEPATAKHKSSTTNSTNSIATCPATVVKSSWSNNNNGSTNIETNFAKGSLIELASGELKRVEDMRAEDFVTSSNKYPSLQLADTTVLKLSPISDNKVVITFVHNNNKVDIESAIGHPYFVYGKGWASYSPDTSLALYRLKCQLLEVGDICISLTPRTSATNNPSSSNTTAAAAIPKSSPRPFAQQPKSQYYPQPELHTNSSNADSRYPPQLPQNLSRKGQPITTTTMSTGVSGRPHALTSFDFNNLPTHHAQYAQQYLNGRNSHNVTAASTAIAAMYRNHSIDAVVSSQKPLDAIGNGVNSVDHGRSSLSPDTDGVIDATTHSSRKRRWSAPDNTCDVDGCQLESKKCTLH